MAPRAGDPVVDLRGFGLGVAHEVLEHLEGRAGVGVVLRPRVAERVEIDVVPRKRAPMARLRGLVGLGPAVLIDLRREQFRQSVQPLPEDHSQLARVDRLAAVRVVVQCGKELEHAILLPAEGLPNP